MCPYTFGSHSPEFSKPTYVQQPLATRAQPRVGCVTLPAMIIILTVASPSSSILWLPCLSSSLWFDFATTFTSLTMVNMLAFATQVADAPVVPFHTVVTKFVWLLWIPFLPQSPSLPRFLKLQW